MSRSFGFSGLGLASVMCLAGASYATQQLAPRGPVPERPAVCIAPTDGPPTVDGVLDDACWKSAVSVRQFNLSYESRYAPYKTEAYLTYDAENLYVGLRVGDPDPSSGASLPYPPDRDPNAAEVLIATPVEETYHKVAVNSEGNVIVNQPMGKAVAWRVAPSAAMQRCDRAPAQRRVEGDSWTAEFRIPFAGVDLPKPQPTGAWRINIGWRTKKCTNYAAWAVTHAWFYETQFFGDLYFGGPQALTAQLEDVSGPKIGANPLPLMITNRRGAPVACEALVTLDTGDAEGARVVFHTTAEAPAGATVKVAANYLLPDGVTGVATVTMRETRNVKPLLRHSVPVEAAPNRRVFREVEAALAPSPQETDKRLADERSAIGEALEAMRRQVWPDGLPPQEWQAQANPLELLLGRACKLLWCTDHAVALGEKPFAVGSLHNLQKVYRDEAYEGALAGVVSLSAAGNEYECVQLLVIPLATNLDSLTVDTTPLTGPSGATIPQVNIEAFWTDFVESRLPRYPIERTGWIADPLIPIAKSPRKISADALHQPLWITVHVPEKTPAGVYDGKVTVRASGSEWPVTLRVRVYDFDLPSRPALRTSMWLNPDHIKDWYGWKRIPKEVMRKEMAFLLAHRINPAWFAPVGSYADIDWQIEHGLNLVMLGSASEWPLPKKMEGQISRYYHFFKDRGLLDLTFIYGQDEPSASDYPKVCDALTHVAEHFPGVQRVCTAFPPVPTLEGSVDTWVVGPNLFNYAAVAERVDAGDKLWLYLSASVRRPYASQLYLDYTALEHRLIGWYCWKYGATGFLYWGINEWGSNNKPWSGRPDIDDAIRAGKRWPAVPWNTWTYLNCNGDAQYIYPGPDGEFWSSVRLEIIRDAFEDYDYLALLRDARNKLAAASLPGTQAVLGDADALLTIGPPLISDLTLATSDPTVLVQRRDAIAELVEQMNHRIRLVPAEPTHGSSSP